MITDTLLLSGIENLCPCLCPKNMLALYSHNSAAEHIPIVQHIAQQFEDFNGELHIHSLGSRDLRIILRTLLAQPEELKCLIIESSNLCYLSVALCNVICAATELQVLVFDRCQFAVNALYTQVLANLHLTKIRELSIIGCKLTDSQIVSFARSFESLPYLSKLCLSHNHIKDSTVVQLFKALRNYYLDTLDLRFCGLGFQSGKTILSFLDSYPGNIQHLFIDYNNFSTNLQNHLLQRCAAASSQAQTRGLSRSRSGSRSPQERRSGMVSSISVRTKITGFDNDDADEYAEIDMRNGGSNSNWIHGSHAHFSGMHTNAAAREDNLDIVDLQSHTTDTMDSAREADTIMLLSALSGVPLKDTLSGSTLSSMPIENCANTKELAAFLSANPDDTGSQLDVDFKTFRWTFSADLATFQSIIASCQKRHKKLNKADLQVMLSILRRLLGNSVTYNNMLQLDMKHKLAIALKRSDTYADLQAKRANLTETNIAMDNELHVSREELRVLDTRVSELETSITAINENMRREHLDERISELLEKIEVTKSSNEELLSQLEATQQVYEEILAAKWNQQSSAVGTIEDIRQSIPSYAEARDAYCQFLSSLAEDLLARVRGYKDELSGLLDAIAAKTM